MQVNNVSFTGTPIHAGKLVEQQFQKIKFNYTMSNLLEHTDRDYFNLQRAQKNTGKKITAPNLKSHAESLKDFFEKGVMF